MKFQIDTLVLKQALETVNHATANISTTPILENILLKVLPSSIIFTANNLEMAIEHTIENDVQIESEGSFCVPSKIFTNYISLLQDPLVFIELLGDNSLHVKTQNSNIKIKGHPASDFPLIPTLKENLQFELDASVIKRSIEKTLFSSAEGNIRPTLAGIYVNIFQENARFATTDSFRLSEYKVQLDTQILDQFSQIIPSKTASELRGILEEKSRVKLILSDNQIVFIFGKTKFYSRLLNGKFPEYEGFFPNIYNTKAVCDRIDLIQALKKINLMSRVNNYSIKASFSHESGILIETPETQIGEVHVHITGSIEGEEAIIGLNSEYLLQVLQVIDTSHISLSFESPLSPLLIVGIDDTEKKSKDLFRHIIMPLKI